MKTVLSQNSGKFDKAYRPLLRAGLLQNSKWVESQSPINGQINASMNAKILAITKSLLTAKEAEYLMMGPPEGVPSHYWVCCLNPCPKRPQYQQVDAYHMEVLRYLCFGFTEDYDGHRERMSTFLESALRHQDLLLESSTPRNEGFAFVDTELIPVRKLPQHHKEGILKANPNYKSILDNLFVCPQHFQIQESAKEGQDKIKYRLEPNSRRRGVSFSFHSLMCQLIFRQSHRATIIKPLNPTPEMCAFQRELSSYWVHARRTQPSYPSRAFESFDYEFATEKIMNSVNSKRSPTKLDKIKPQVLKDGRIDLSLLVKHAKQTWCEPPQKSKEGDVRQVIEFRMTRVFKHLDGINAWCEQNNFPTLNSMDSMKDVYLFLNYLHALVSKEENLLVGQKAPFSRSEAKPLFEKVPSLLDFIDRNPRHNLITPEAKKEKNKRRAQQKRARRLIGER